MNPYVTMVRLVNKPDAPWHALSPGGRSTRCGLEVGKVQAIAVGMPGLKVCPQCDKLVA